MVYTQKWFYDQGKNEGLFGIRLVSLVGVTAENNEKYLQGYTEGSMIRVSQSEEEKKTIAIARVEYIRSIGHATASKGYPAVIDHLNEADQLLFMEGYNSGYEEKKGKSR